ncbi:hypothetical protein DPQ25_06265 [Hydrogeniiclostridium mannosilyticum]|uniref:Uncharacterized protein n=1 Tax=Hydrogeniiclostridium mannosilyticum TaxID=2764322 RepID=A0A328UE39_9FIRM|nr:hypothetical protein DPQ25_06265 [Hydrogeniiclostridium mannosilyticum]
MFFIVSSAAYHFEGMSRWSAKSHYFYGISGSIPVTACSSERAFTFLFCNITKMNTIKNINKKIQNLY